MAATAVAQEFTNTSTLLIFWRSDCGVCRRELALLPEIARTHPVMKIMLNCIDRKPACNAFPSMPANVQVIDTPDARSVMLQLGDARRVVPFNALLHKNGSVCRSRMGMLDSGTLSDWLNRC